MPTRCFALLLALTLFAGAVTSAHAGDKRPVDLTLTSGKSISGVVESATEEEVVLRTGPDSTRRLLWKHLTPQAHFRVRAALASPTDGEARMKLAELAVDLGLFVEARVEYEKALALGALSKKAFERVVRQAEHDAVQSGVRQAERIAESGNFEAAMETARQLKLHFASAPNAGAINRLIEKLIKRIHEFDDAASAALEELKKIKLEARRNKEILERKTRAVDEFRKAALLAKQSKAKQEQGSVTKARKLAEQADKNFQEARKNLGRLRRILPRGHTERDKILAELNKLDKAQFDLLFGLAWFLAFDAGAYTQAEKFAARASYIDPVHPDLVDLRDHLMTNRIKYRLSDMTNARGTVRGGGR